MAQNEGSKLELDGFTYEVFMLSPKVARRMLVEMVKVLGPAFAAVVDASGTQGIKNLLDVAVSEVKWGGLITELTSKLDDRMLDDHMNELWKVTQCAGEGDVKSFDNHFRGRLPAMFKWYGWALKVNYGNFSDALASASALLPSKADKPK